MLRVDLKRPWPLGTGYCGSRTARATIALALAGFILAGCQSASPEAEANLSTSSAGGVAPAAAAPTATAINSGEPAAATTGGQRKSSSAGVKLASARAEPTGPKLSETAAHPTLVPSGAAATSAASQPRRRAERHVLTFTEQSIQIYDKPYGRVVSSIDERKFPREALPGSSGQSGVAVYSKADSFVEVAIPGGQAGWVRLEQVRLSAMPCAVTPVTGRERAGPIGAGSTSVDCVKR